MRLADFNPGFREALAAHECFRRLGFAPDDIHVALSNGQLYVVVRRDGLEFALHVGPCDMRREVFATLWGAAVSCWNETAEEDERHELFHGSRAKAMGGHLVFALLRKGFKVPYRDGARAGE